MRVKKKPTNIQILHSYLIKWNAIFLQYQGGDESHLVPQKGITNLGAPREESWKKGEQIGVCVQTICGKYSTRLVLP